MNLAFDTLIAADAETRAGLFAASASDWAPRTRNVEQDFWVRRWTLDALFNVVPAGVSHLLFNDGNSLPGALA